MRFLRSAVLFVALLASGACMGPRDVANRYYATETFAPRPAEQVSILSKAPGRPYEVIAEFQSRNETPVSMQKRAAEIGADAVIITLVGGAKDLDEEWASSDRYKNKSYSRILGVALRYKDEEAK